MRCVEFSNRLLTFSCFLAGASALGCSSEPEYSSPGTVTSTTGGGNSVTTSATGTTGTTGTGTTGTGTTGAGVTGTTGFGGNTATGVTGTGTTAGQGVTGAGGGSTTAGPSTTGSVGNCQISVDSYDVSSAIPTVGIITWSAASPIDSATIEFGPAGSGFTMSAPVDLNEQNYRTLLLGMKGESDYSFQVVASSGGQTCMSETFTLQTGPVATNVPRISRQVMDQASATNTGFIITSAGLGGFGPGGVGGQQGGGAPAFIFDMDGDPVWWAPAPASCSRARMDWEGKNMWMLELNVDRGGGEMRRVSMDGMDSQNAVQGLNNTHHDFTVLPGGIIASVSWTSSGGVIGMNEPPSDLIERAPDGTITTVATLDSNYYQASGQGFHANSILWHEEDQTYTISDRYPNLYIKVKRTGELVWQFGGSNPVDASKYISGGSWQVNHGHQLLDNGNLLIFNNNVAGNSPVIEYALDTQSMTASKVWEYSGGTSNVLGDVQRIDNGNTFVTYSVSGVIQEVKGNQVLQTYTTDSVGYSMYRPTLYGPPPK